MRRVRVNRVRETPGAVLVIVAMVAVIASQVIVLATEDSVWWSVLAGGFLLAGLVLLFIGGRSVQKRRASSVERPGGR